MESYLLYGGVVGVISLLIGYYIGKEGISALITNIQTDITNLKTDVTTLKVKTGVTPPVVTTPTTVTTVTGVAAPTV